MKFANVGSVDRIIRLLLAAGLIALPFVRKMDLTSMPSIAAFAVAAILAFTAIVRFCPIYGIFGMFTRSKD